MTLLASVQLYRWSPKDASYFTVRRRLFVQLCRTPARYRQMRFFAKKSDFDQKTDDSQGDSLLREHTHNLILPPTHARPINARRRNVRHYACEERPSAIRFSQHYYRSTTPVYIIDGVMLPVVAPSGCLKLVCQSHIH